MKMQSKNYLDELNYAETEKQMLEMLRKLPIGHFRSLVKCVGIVINEFSEITDKEDRLLDS